MEVELEEKDWNDVKDRAKKMIRDGLMQVEMSRMSLAHAEAALKKIWDKLPEEEKRKRNPDKAKEEKIREGY